MLETIVIRGSDLRKMRIFAHLRTIDMAHAAGVKTRKTYENWEKGLGTPNVNQFVAMATACGLDVRNHSIFKLVAFLRKCGGNFNYAVPELIQMVDAVGLKRIEDQKAAMRKKEEAIEASPNEQRIA